MRDELAAQQLEMAHETYRANLLIGHVKKRYIPAPFKFPRPVPWEPEQEPVLAESPQPRKRKDGRRHATTVAEVVAVVSAGFGPSRG